MRLDKFICDCTGCSRKEAKEGIKKGYARMEDVIVKKPEYKVETQKVFWMGKELQYEQFHYYMMNKKAGVVTANADAEHETVFSDWSSPGKGYFAVGRLDRDTEGLLLITNDGELGHRLTAPAHHVDKVYYVETTKNIEKETVSVFAKGMDIGEKKILLPAKLTILGEKKAEVTIHEGKYHQIKRMFEKVGNQVAYLKRLSMGELVLDEKLVPGEYRELTSKEREGLLKGWQRKSIMQ